MLEKCEELENTCNALREENDELRVKLHDYQVMVGLFIYLFKG